MIKAIIVDDDELCRTVISDLLKEVDGFECIANFETRWMPLNS